MESINVVIDDVISEGEGVRNWIEPKKVEKALRDEYWVNTMHEKINQFERNNVRYLVLKASARLESIQILLAVAYTLGFKLYQMNVQAPRAWYDRHTTYIIERSFSRGGANRTLFIRCIEETIVIAQIYVDDIIFCSPIDLLAHEFAKYIKQEFEMSMVGKLSYFLGLQVKQIDDGLFISQSKYAKNLINRFGLDSKKHTKTPMNTSVNIGYDPIGRSVDPTLYRSMIGSLLYLTTSRLDIAFSVGVYARFQVDPKESHLSTVRRIVRYVNGTLDHRILYSRDSNLDLVSYSDAD
ncbi:uncharacterized protein LOC111389996 [Olea europaea var. sylvestris]|uniref:uncharacterized protein LOC111389996 n=1 Tax=Olea europaea var. sylvestris TaxID=158386 RepID=UPI000C1D28F8|nr:uncharacterized protein LOC111389996 [Olea europaea var. sylvestris]